MSGLLDHLKFFKQTVVETFSDKHGVLTNQDRSWEEGYRQRWRHDKVVRSTHGVNCTGSCSWKVYVKNGLVTWETQQTDYPETRPDLPNHEPRGCPRGASYSWYLYSAHRIKFPLVRTQLLKLWREAKKSNPDPVDAWGSIVSDPVKAKSYKEVRGLGGFVRGNWDEMQEIIAASNAYTIKTFGPDRVVGFSPIPAMSMVSYTAGSRYLSLIGGVCMSFYDWYCDLPVASPQTWGEQTDVPESADWYNSNYIIAWGSNVPMTRTPDAHFLTEVRYKGAKTVAVTPDFSEVARLTDHWLNPKQGTDSAMAMAMQHVILKEFHLGENKSEYFEKYVRENSDLPNLVQLDNVNGKIVPGRYLRAADLDNNMNELNNPEWKTLAIDETTGDIVVPKGSIGFRWGQDGSWNIESKDSRNHDVKLQLTFIDNKDAVEAVAFPYFASDDLEGVFKGNKQQDVFERNVPIKKINTANGEIQVATVYDLMMANYSLDRGLGGEGIATSYDDNVPYTPAWQEIITGVPRDQVITIAREFAENAHKTEGKSMIIIGASVNHWYHSDMHYRAVISMLVTCGCIGVSGGGWAHYVGQEKLRPQSGWVPIAFGLDWTRPPRHMNSTSFWYSHSNQWRYEKLNSTEQLSPLAQGGKIPENILDCNVRAERMGWLPSAPQLNSNPLEILKKAKAAGQETNEFLINSLKDKSISFASEDPDSPENFPRNLFVWRSNLLGSSAKGHEYFLKHLLGTVNGVRGKDLGEEGGIKPTEVKWHEEAPEGKLDLLVTLDFRMSTTCIHSDIVLPTATWYEKNDMNTSDMHPFIHPLSKAVDPAWESRSDWDIFSGIAKKFSEVCVGHLGEEEDVVLLPIQHDSPKELAQPFGVKDWSKGECEPIPGKTMPLIMTVKRNYPETYARMTSVGPLLKKLGNGGKGMNWNTELEIDELVAAHGAVQEGPTKGQPIMVTDVQVAETILRLAPETNGHVAKKAWNSLAENTGRDHSHLVDGKEHEKIHFKDIQAQPRKIITSPIWSGIESDEVSYTACYTNINERIPWRTLTGRQQLYQDHEWMREYGEQFVSYKPPVDTKSLGKPGDKNKNPNPEIVLNILTPHQKWGIHSTYTDNLLMLSLGRGGSVAWISEDDAKKADISDNDWIEIYNANGALAARAIVSQRIPNGAIFKYHAQEKNINTPLAAETGTRGIHNSVSRIVMKPTHMIGGYAHQAYGFNYIGTIGTNRDEFVRVRKMDQVEWDA